MRAPVALPRSRRVFVSSHRFSLPHHRSTGRLHDGDSPLWSRELTDRTRVPMSLSASIGNVVSGDPLQVPFRALLLGYATHPTLLSLATGHTLLFDALSASTDLLQQLTMLNPCRGHLVEMQGRCVDAAWRLVRYYQADAQRVLELPLKHRHLLDDMRLVYLITSASPNAGLLVSKELTHGRELSLDVACTLLSLPCTPDILRAILVFTFRTHAAAVDAPHFQRCAHALLSNDNFFSERTFASMHSLLHDVLLPSLRCGAARNDSFDFVAVRWTTLMNKWSRVYAKSGRGFDLHDCLETLLQAVPAAETKLPASFYIRLLGALLDATAAGEAPRSAKAGWERMKTVAGDALRLFGRNPEDLRAVWVLLLKGALTLPPAEGDHWRLLEAYHLCAQRGHAVVVDRQGFRQVIRLVAAAVSALPLPQVTQLVRSFCTFLHEQTSVSFLWLLDGVGTVLTELWQHHRLEAQGEAEQLLRVLRMLLRERCVSGVELHSNPVIARALDHFRIGGAAAYWWTCGCGEVIPCTSKRCASCLRKSGVSWVCPQCHAAHKLPCKTQSCSCECLNPRMAAAVNANVCICDKCGGLITAAGCICARCKQQRQESERTVECAHCHGTYKGNGLHCPQCFSPNPDKHLHLWHCVDCDDFNYSIWSSCRSCKTPRRIGALRVSFVPWKCGCGALNHPCRLTCGRCGTGEHHHTYTCAGCDARVSLHSLRRTLLTVDGKTLSLHLCPKCQCPHPRDDLVLYSPSFSRHCMLCAHTVKPSSISASGSFFHCDTVQRVNEHYLFRCTHCDYTELQTGYHCQRCHFPRPEMEALLQDESAGAAPLSHVWRCLHETDDGALCGQWNYGWSARCLACRRGRPDSACECRAKAQMWACDTCGKPNRPIDVLFCAHCKTGLQPVLACATCGLPHMSYACRACL
ncbi:hypothetical protein, conserved [Leishmania donovani]|uniref:RanBP2-type domain-containing protein n=1 Tax=Leishmania donovani TaxID=5661 RepID=E9BG17_LEIDO|nr:hypothetical protein, conserved [Leishmania donovani]CBZ34193.1 hypothetical protein, conserved [Leishmania donovani]